MYTITQLVYITVKHNHQVKHNSQVKHNRISPFQRLLYKCNLRNIGSWALKLTSSTNESYPSVR